MDLRNSTVLIVTPKGRGLGTILAPNFLLTVADIFSGLSPEEIRNGENISFQYVKYDKDKRRYHHERNLKVKYMESRKDFNLILFKIEHEQLNELTPVHLVTCDYLNSNLVSAVIPFDAKSFRRLLWIHCRMIGEDPKNTDFFELSIRSKKQLEELNLSGAPIIHDRTGQIIGIWYSNLPSRKQKIGRGLTSDAICKIFPEIEFRDHSFAERKVIVVGDAGVGKTSLINKLIDRENKLRENFKATRGIDINSVHLAQPKVKVNYWDFGGQDIYRSLHSLFFTDGAIYLLVFDGRERNPKLSYWIDSINFYSRNNKILLVRTKKDKNGKTEVQIERLNKSSEEIVGLYEVDLKSNVGLDELEDSLKKTLEKQSAYFNDPIPNSWQKSKQAIEKVARDRTIIDYTQFKEICSSEGGVKSEKELQNFRKYLHDAGSIIYFQNNTYLYEIIVLQPLWLHSIINRLLDSELLRSKEGRFISFEALRAAFKEGGQSEYLKELIEIMCHYNLCVKTEREKYILPLLLPASPPEYEWSTENNIEIIFEYKFLPKPLFSKLIANLSAYIEEDDLLWRQGVVFNKDSARAEIKENSEDKRVILRLSGSNKKSLLTIIRSEIERIHLVYDHIDFKTLVPCNCKECSSGGSPNLYVYESLEKRLAKGIPTVECPLSYTDVAIISLIDDEYKQKNVVHSSRIFAKGDFRIGDVLYQAQSKPKNDVFFSYSKEDQQAVLEVAEALESEDIKFWFDSWHLEPGMSISDEIQKQINNSKTVAIFIGQKSARSKWLKKEISIAQKLDKKIIPILLPEIEPESIPTELLDLNYIQLESDSVAPIDELIFGITGTRSHNLKAKSLIKKARKFVARNDVREAINLLLTITGLWPSSILTDSIILLANRYNKIRSEKQSGGITTDEEIQLENKISSDILNILNDIQRENKSNRKKILEEKIKEAPENIDAWRELAKIYEQTGEKDKEKEAIRIYKHLLDNQDFIRNTKNPVCIYQLHTRETGFFGPVDWHLQPTVNILLGRNGYGKSQLFRMMIGIMMKDNDIMPQFFQNKKPSSKIELGYLQDNKKVETVRTAVGFEYGIGRVPVLAIPDTRFINKSRSTVSLIEEERKDIVQDGGYHFLYQIPYEGAIQNFLYGLCNDYLENDQSFRAPIFNLLENVVTELTKDKFKFESIRRVSNIEFEILVQTEGNYDHPLPIQMASQGTLSVLTIIGVIYNFLKSLYPDTKEEELTKQKAIIFIDEVDAHLHPVWQQKIIMILRRYFPNTQFLVSAHSPLVVAGCREKEVAVLRKSSSGFVVQQLENDFIGWKSNDIFDLVFEVEEKDASFLEYGRKVSKHNAIKDEIKKLESKPNLSREEESRLEELIDEDKGIQQYKVMNEKRWNEENMEEVNQDLREQILLLKDEIEQLKEERKDG